MNNKTKATKAVNLLVIAREARNFNELWRALRDVVHAALEVSDTRGTTDGSHDRACDELDDALKNLTRKEAT